MSKEWLRALRKFPLCFSATATVLPSMQYVVVAEGLFLHIRNTVMASVMVEKTVTVMPILWRHKHIT